MLVTYARLPNRPSSSCWISESVKFRWRTALGVPFWWEGINLTICQNLCAGAGSLGDTSIGSCSCILTLGRLQFYSGHPAWKRYKKKRKL
jgi:hypothetical protein